MKNHTIQVALRLLLFFWLFFVFNLVSVMCLNSLWDEVYLKNLKHCSDKDSQSLSDITDCNFALKHPWSTFAL